MLPAQARPEGIHAGGEAPFRARVAAFYRSRGYEVRENPRVRGLSERVYSVSMVAEGPLGALLVSFGDAGGVDAIELSRVRTLARDIGATPVLAAPELDPDLRRMAAQLAVVVLEASALADDGEGVAHVDGPDLRRDLDAHPWPASGRARPDDALPVPPAGLRDVEDILSQLGSSQIPANRGRGDGDGLWKAKAPPSEGPPLDGPAAPRHKPFTWLAAPHGLPEVAPHRPTVDDVLPPADPLPVALPAPRQAPASASSALPPARVAVHDEPEPLTEHEEALVARATTLSRARDLARGAADRRGWVRFGVGVAAAAALLFAAIRFLT